ncbi:putative 5-amino-6-(5-phosphoribosylamino)uracil reductase [Glarea lozoyensis 74030]|uniref:2,5-diamino-6-ribosylamino-4(3H)-pyrimidinone 5'-phosphate reductase n=1 Tax=Glarea lozoyensis (strain ATCC 74030 / MF5533) TaxID=1104152 RepID=H0EQ57_GLAL7|nr:putative 5-amino-6-(5-phosphoribosylamino)uracil reductase [Glarea lozoyensis 74030]
MPDPPRDVLHYPSIHRTFLEPHLPPKTPSTASPYPFTTLTFATSLDSQLALSPGAPTALSGPESKAMTHYLRSRHDAILIGVGTAVADNPSLNCRIEGVGGYGGEGLEGQPRPIVLDPRARWEVNDRRNDSCGKPIAAARLDGVKWYPLGEDVVLCGKMKLDG